MHLAYLLCPRQFSDQVPWHCYPDALKAFKFPFYLFFFCFFDRATSVVFTLSEPCLIFRSVKSLFFQIAPFLLSLFGLLSPCSSPNEMPSFCIQLIYSCGFIGLLIECRHGLFDRCLPFIGCERRSCRNGVLTVR